MFFFCCFLKMNVYLCNLFANVKQSSFQLRFSYNNIDQFSIECRKTKTKVITLANHKRRRAIHCPIKTRSNYTKRGKTRASKSRLVLVLLVIGVGFTSDWLRKWHEFFKPITKRSNAKPK